MELFNKLRILETDVFFVSMILLSLFFIIQLLWTVVKTGYKRAMIENMQQMDYKKTLEVAQLEEAPGLGKRRFGNLILKGKDAEVPSEEDKSLQRDDDIQQMIGMYKVHMGAPATAQYGRENATYIPSLNHLPMSTIPNVNMKAPWSLSQIQAAEVPDKVGCRKSATGLFHECGVEPISSACAAKI